MSISKVASGSLLVTQASPEVVGYPLDFAADDKLVILVGYKRDSRNLATPTDWTGTTKSTGGAGATGSTDEGATATMYLHKDALGSETGSVTLSWDVAPAPGMALMSAFRKTTPGAWETAFAGGADSDTSTDQFSVTATADPGFKAGDVLIVTAMLPNDSFEGTNRQVTVPGCTLGALSVIVNEGTTTAADGRIVSYYCTVNAGTSTGAPTFSMTTSLGIPATGSAQFLRLREPAGNTATISQPSTVTSTGFGGIVDSGPDFTVKSGQQGQMAAVSKTPDNVTAKPGRWYFVSGDFDLTTRLSSLTDPAATFIAPTL